MSTERIENFINKYLAEEFNYSAWNGLVVHRKTGDIQILQGLTVLMTEKLTFEHINVGTYRLKSNGLFLEGKIEDLNIDNYYPEYNKAEIGCFTSIYRIDNDNLEIKVLEEEGGAPVDKRLIAHIHLLIYA